MERDPQGWGGHGDTFGPLSLFSSIYIFNDNSQLRNSNQTNFC